MNYSATAEKLYVHINTIRKRIDKVNELLQIDWSDNIARMYAELLLRFLYLLEKIYRFLEQEFMIFRAKDDTIYIV